jgi:hypothetical protein
MTSGLQCSNRPKLDGYCLIHHPKIKAEKNAKLRNAWNRRFEERQAGHKRAARIRELEASLALVLDKSLNIASAVPNGWLIFFTDAEYAQICRDIYELNSLRAQAAS